MPPFIDQFDRADNAGSLGAPLSGTLGWAFGQWLTQLLLSR